MRYAILTIAFAIFWPLVFAIPQTQSGAGRDASQESDQQYFPVGVFEDNPRQSSFKENWYAGYLAKMEEPSLFETAKSSDFIAYRFLLIAPSRGLSARLALHADGTGDLEARKLVVLHHYGRSHIDRPQIILRKYSALVSEEQVQQLLTLLQKAGFWSMKTYEKDLGGLDGTEWILEGVRSHSYHVVDRWSPEESDYQQVCSYLMGLSPLKLEKNDWSMSPR